MAKKKKALRRTTRRKTYRKSRKEVVGYRPRIVVKFHDYVEIPYEDRVEKHIQKLRIGPWDRLVKEFPGITFRRLYTALNPEKIRTLVDSATERDRTYKPPNLLTYFVMDCPPGVAPKALVKALSSWQAVQMVYFDPPGDEPQLNPANDPRWPNQGYLDPAPNGIDAEFAWPRAGGLGFPGGDGAGLRVIDLERGWTLNHEDLTAQGATLLHGAIRNGSRSHGTSVLGEICAVDNALGCIGIVPKVASVDVVSYWNSTRSNAILAAIANLSFGDVLLIEAQIDINWPNVPAELYPIELLDAEFDTIRLATALGIVVVAAAGNGDNDLDAYTDAFGNAIFNRTANGFRDSGAIMVGAATSTVPHRRMDPIITALWPVPWGSNFGSRVDCYAWGENVDTCRSNTAASTTLYTGIFSGTSSASPIVTGAALIVQGIAADPASGIGYRFSPRQLRVILSDPATGTASNNPAVDRIGVMPDLRAIIQNVLNVAPDVYIRDFVGDTGDPHSGAISASPDIILRQTTVANPQASFGQGSGTENNNTLGAEASTAVPNNYIYVRVLNRGGSPANVNATIYWSPVSTLLTPDLWTKVPLAGPPPSVTIPNVPTGDVLTVSNAITWPTSEIPAPGHYCFVGLIGTADDPAPDPADFLDWDNYRRFIRENNNVTWRNFNVVPHNVAPGAGDPAGYVGLPFLAPGAPDRARPMQLEVMAKLPKGARAFLEMPAYLADAMQEHSPFVKMYRRRHAARLPVNPHGRTTYREVIFAAKSRAKLRLLVRIPEKLREYEYEVFVRQLYKGEEVGRVTWRLVPQRRKVRTPKQRKAKR